MSMSAHVVGFRPPDEKWRQMKAVWDACQAAGLEVPQDVMKFFGYDPPDAAGVKVSDTFLQSAGALREWRERGVAGFEVEIAKLPANVTHLRFYNSW